MTGHELPVEVREQFAWDLAHGRGYVILPSFDAWHIARALGIPIPAHIEAKAESQRWGTEEPRPATIPALVKAICERKALDEVA